jgi:hypothetical protein
VHREIIDIREGSSFDFIVPYVSLTPYRDVTETLGSLQVTVINPLIAPSTVSTTITFLVEAAAAPDFEFAVPNQNISMTPVAVYNPQSSSFIPKPAVDSITSGVIGGSALTSDSHISARSCIGEKIVSINSFLKKYTWRSGLPANITSIKIDPFALPINYTDAVTNDVTGSTDYVALFSQMYAVSRGSVRMKIIPDSTGAVINNWRAIYTALASGTYNGHTSNPPVPVSWNPQLVLRSSYQGNGFELQIPQYTAAYGRSTLGESYSAVQKTKQYATPTTSNAQIRATTDNSVGNSYYIAAGDDFQLGYFIGVPAFAVVSDS